MRTSKNRPFSIKISAGSRTYYFDVKASVGGTKYLVIKELRGDTKEGQIMIFGEHVQAFRRGFRKATRFLRKSRSKTYDMEQLRSDHPKAYVKWAEKEDDRLKELSGQGITIKELASIFQRKPSAIRSRLRKLEESGPRKV